jgi:hypothetical protein
MELGLATLCQLSGTVQRMAASSVLGLGIGSLDPCEFPIPPMGGWFGGRTPSVGSGFVAGEGATVGEGSSLLAGGVALVWKRAKAPLATTAAARA